MQDLRYNHIGFNVTWVASVSFNEFKRHEAHHGLTDKQLREVYALCKQLDKDSSFPPNDVPDAGTS